MWFPPGMLLHGLFQIDLPVSKMCFLDVELPGELEKYCVVNRCLSPHAFELVPGHVQQSLRQLSHAAFFIKERREVTGFKIVLQRTDSPLEQQSGIFQEFLGKGRRILQRIELPQDCPEQSKPSQAFVAARLTAVFDAEPPHEPGQRRGRNQ